MCNLQILLTSMRCVRYCTAVWAPPERASNSMERALPCIISLAKLYIQRTGVLCEQVYLKVSFGPCPMSRLTDKETHIAAPYRTVLPQQWYLSFLTDRKAITTGKGEYVYERKERWTLIRPACVRRQIHRPTPFSWKDGGIDVAVNYIWCILR
jgi:hypothetical protein